LVDKLRRSPGVSPKSQHSYIPTQYYYPKMVAHKEVCIDLCALVCVCDTLNHRHPDYATSLAPKHIIQRNTQFDQTSFSIILLLLE